MTEVADAAVEVVEEGFDPSKHFSQISGRDYLEVKWRLVWLHDDAIKQGYKIDIATDCTHLEQNFAVFKATVTVLDVMGQIVKRATGHGQEEKNHFQDFLEKAETKAIGRALAALGYGTQFVTDFEFDSSGERMVDSPVDRGSQGNGQPRVTRPGDPPSPRQMGYLERLLGERAVAGEDVGYHVQRLHDTQNNRGDKLDRRTVSDWIKLLTEDHVIPPVPEDANPKVEGAEQDVIPSEIRARLLMRSDKEQTVWRNIVKSRDKKRETWRELVRIASQMTEATPDDPKDESWRWAILIEYAPINSEIVDGIAKVADRHDAMTNELEDMIVAKLNETR